MPEEEKKEERKVDAGKEKHRRLKEEKFTEAKHKEKFKDFKK